MTSPTGQPFNVARDGSRVGMQGQYIRVETVTIPGGNVQLTVGQDATPEVKYRAGVENLKSGNPTAARKLIWDAMMSDHVNSSEVLFHWLVAMLSGRTVRQFSDEEIAQLKRSRCRYAGAGSDAWSDGVRLIYQLLGSVLPSHVTEAEQRTTDIDMSLLVKQFDNLGEKQRDMIRPHLELFLTGPRQDEMWQRELKSAQSRQHSRSRLGRAWMFFQPIPAKVLLPPSRPEWISATDQRMMRACACLFAAAAGYFGWELLWHGAFVGLLGYLAALAGGGFAAGADLELRFLTERRRQKDELFQASNQPTPDSADNELTGRVNTLFNRYFRNYAPDKVERERWEAATAGFRQFHQLEIIAICQGSGIPANEVAWLIRYQVRQLKHRWQNGSLYEYQRLLVPQRGTAATRQTGLAALALGGVWAVIALWAHVLADVAAVAAVAGVFWAWRYRLRINLERRRYAADSTEHTQRQAAIDEEFRRWCKKLEARPKDADMAAWLECDRTVLLGQALDHFQLPRSRLKAYAFLEEPGVAARRARIEGGPLRFSKYRLLVILLAEDGVRQVRANLAFMTGTLTINERTSYRYDAIISVRASREARRGHTFELRLAAGDPITVLVRDGDPAASQQNQDTEPTEETQEAPEAEEDTAADVTSLADLMHMLEGVAGEGRNWFQGHEWAGAWSGS
jgi:hypothetical protein